MFVINWCNGDEVFTCCTGNNRDAFQVYWAIKQLLETYNFEYRNRGWISIFLNGRQQDPVNGESLGVSDREDKTMYFGQSKNE